MFKYLRIAVTALSLTACVLLIALWVQSYYSSRQHIFGRWLTITSWQGVMEVNPKFLRIVSQSQLRARPKIPHGSVVLLALTCAGLPWVRWSKGFSLRELLIITALIAVGLWFVVAAIYARHT
jgi:hypothetical protein